MKKNLATTLFITAAIIIFVSSCKSKHGTCAAYAQAPAKHAAKHI